MRSVEKFQEDKERLQRSPEEVLFLLSWEAGIPFSAFWIFNGLLEISTCSSLIVICCLSLYVYVVGCSGLTAYYYLKITVIINAYFVFKNAHLLVHLIRFLCIVTCLFIYYTVTNAFPWIFFLPPCSNVHF